MLVRSYRTVSPLPVRRSSPSAVCSLWHCPAGRPDWVLPSTVPCGVRTFLGPVRPVRGRPADSPPPPFSRDPSSTRADDDRPGQAEPDGLSGLYALDLMAVPAALARAERQLIDREEGLTREEVAAVAALPLDTLPDLIALAHRVRLA